MHQYHGNPCNSSILNETFNCNENINTLKREHSSMEMLQSTCQVRYRDIIPHMPVPLHCCPSFFDPHGILHYHIRHLQHLCCTPAQWRSIIKSITCWKHQTFTSLQVWLDGCWAHCSRLALQLGSVISQGTHSENGYKNSSRLARAGLGEGKFQTKKSFSKKVNSFPSLDID